MIGRYGYDLQPRTFADLRDSVHGQMLAQQSDDYVPLLDAVILTPEAFAEFVDRFAQIERMVAEIPAMVQGIVRAELKHQ